MKAKNVTKFAVWFGFGVSLSLGLQHIIEYSLLGGASHLMIATVEFMLFGYFMSRNIRHTNLELIKDLLEDTERSIHIDPSETGDHTGYDLTDGGRCTPENMLVSEEQIKQVNDVIALLKSSEHALVSTGLVEEM